MSVILSELPAELILQILQPLDNESLLQISSTCRSLHAISLGQFFSNNSASIHLDSERRILIVKSQSPPQTFPALRRALFTDQLEEFHISFSPDGADRLLSDVLQLNSLFARLRITRIIDLDFAALGRQLPPQETLQSIDPTVWKKMFTNLLELVLSRSCVELQIRSSSCITKLIGENKAQSTRYMPKAGVSFWKPFSSLGRELLSRYSTSGSESTLGKPSSLKKFLIQGPLLMTPTFEEWTISTLKSESSTITTLILDSVEISGSEWSRLMNALNTCTFPSLKVHQLSKQDSVSTYRLGGCLQVSFRDVKKFIDRHASTISHLHLDSITLARESVNEQVGSAPALPQLVSLNAHPRVVAWLLQHSRTKETTSPQLDSVTISAAYPETTVNWTLGSPSYQRNLWDLALWSVASTPATKLSMQLVNFHTVVSGLEGWCREHVEDGSSFPPVQCITSLSFSFRYVVGLSKEHWAQDSFASLHLWLSLFPDLEHVEFHERILEDFYGFVKKVSLACPNLKTLRVRNEAVFDLDAVRRNMDPRISL